MKYALFGVLAVAAFAVAVTSLFTNSVAAKINEVTTDTSCSNGGGNEPGGQQPSCTGSGLTQNTESENQNPAGSAPPGQNK